MSQSQWLYLLYVLCGLQSKLSMLQGVQVVEVWAADKVLRKLEEKI